MYKVITVVGARPQFVKAATISRIIRNTDGIGEQIIHTGQHFDSNMSEVFFTEMEIPKPDYQLKIHSLNHGAMTGRMMEGLEELFMKESPDIVLVYGDTNSTLAGSLTARKLHIPVAHVEAGLRSFNMHMPEEVNRILTDRISNILYCPTELAKQNLLNEGYKNFNTRIVVSGDVMFDAALFYAEKSDKKSLIRENLQLENYVLCTLHRAENTDDPSRLEEIIKGLNQVNDYSRVILPLHPRTKKKLSEIDTKLNFEPIEPVSYFDMISLIKGSELVITDSGGLQKEAYFFFKPCITMRDQTEWQELVDNNVNQLTGADSRQIIESFEKMKSIQVTHDKALYGNGHAAELIVQDLLNYL